MSLAILTPLLAIGVLLSLSLAVVPEAAAQFRPPAVPLVDHDPYFCVWSFDDKLTDGWTRHWTGANNAMCGLASIDGATYRYAGGQPDKTPAMEQTGLEVLPTRTVYRFQAAGVDLTLTFLTPALPHDLDVLSRPLTYLTWSVRSTDGKKHAVKLYYDITAEWAVNTTDQKVQWSRVRAGAVDAMRVGTVEQPVLATVGDNRRIDWGYAYLGLPNSGDLAKGVSSVMGNGDAVRAQFATSGTLPDCDDLAMPRAAQQRWPVLACSFDLGQVGADAVEKLALVAYDDEWSIELLDRRLRPYWRRNGMDAQGLLTTALNEYEALDKRCKGFDAEFVADMKKLGGDQYVGLATLAYRQSLSANKIAADFDGAPAMFPKENFSNGCIATVDVHYPASPLYLLMSPTMLKAQLTPVLDYASSARWKFPFAPHDMGTYPLANGQVYGGGERTEENQMPVEECGNMLLMMAALAKADANADYSLKYWPTVTKWADFLLQKGLDPENQLCTDDFAGHLAHNTNLSLKAILAIGAYSTLADMAGKKDAAATYRKSAQEMAAKWQEMAKDGDHFRLAFDRPGTWSQKYNLVWDRILGLNLFPMSVAQTEVAYYKTRLAKYGLPLDNRSTYTKTDWEVWTATLTGKREDFDALMAHVYAFMNETPSRVPLTDWYETPDAKMVGFRARSVVGGIFLPALYDEALWKKWRQ